MAILLTRTLQYFSWCCLVLLGDIIISIESQDVEEADHKTIVSLLQNTPSTVR